MKKKKLLALVLALVLILAAALPAYAAEGGEPELPEEAVPPEDLLGVEIPDEAVPGGEAPDGDVPSEGTTDGDAPSEEVPSEGTADGDAPSEEVPSEGTADGDAPSEEVPSEGAADEAASEIPEEEENPVELEAAVIDVQVPANGRVVINPYGMEVSTAYGTSTDQIVHEPQILISGSDFPVRVSARAVGRLEPESTARFVSAPPAADAEDKEIFLYVEFQNDPMLWNGSFADWPNQLLVTEYGAEKADVMALDVYGVGYFRLFGAMTESPYEMWGSVDAPDVTLAFTFSTWEDSTLPAEEEPTEEEPAEEPAETPAEEPVEEPAEEPVEKPVEEPTEEPAEPPAEVEDPTEPPADLPTEGESPAEIPEGMEENNVG